MTEVIITVGKASYNDNRRRYVFGYHERASVPDKVARLWASQGAAKLVGGTDVVEAEAAPSPEPPSTEPVGYAGLHIKELRAECKARGIKVPRDARKPDIVALLEEDDATDEQPDDGFTIEEPEEAES